MPERKRLQEFCCDTIRRTQSKNPTSQALTSRHFLPGSRRCLVLQYGKRPVRPPSGELRAVSLKHLTWKTISTQIATSSPSSPRERGEKKPSPQIQEPRGGEKTYGTNPPAEVGLSPLPGGSTAAGGRASAPGRATWKSPGLCCAPCAPQHRSNGRQLHDFLTLMSCSSPLFPQTHPNQFPVPFLGFGSVCPRLAQMHRLGFACLSVVPPLNPWAVITSQQGTADGGLRCSVLEL